MIEVVALLAAFLDATGREAAIWERRDGGDPVLLGSSSHVFAAHTMVGVAAWDAIAWARANDLHAQLVTTGDSVGWLFV